MRTIPPNKTKAEGPPPAKGQADAIVAVARVAAPHGTKGWLRLMVYGIDPDFLAACPELHLQEPGGPWRRRDPLERKPAHRALLVRYEGCADPEQAGALRHSLVGLRRAALPPLEDGSYYWCDLIGLAVEGEDGERLGTVAGIAENRASALLEV
ncbi:MAG: 16S rRNA processing protein RimM, partial [Betaproteobacteria bacterium AqS2]|nr:16S rRNA processing protein RimM [Betaproteobacteria bacterium AqS2]